MIINSLTILIVAGICGALYFAFRLGLEVGYDRGNIEGRRSQRSFYQKNIDEVRAYYEGLRNEGI